MSGMGGFGMGGYGGGPNMDEMRLQAMMQEMQMADSLRMYNELVLRCFDNCVDSFRTRKIDTKENACIEKCAHKFVQFAARVGMRFQEHQQQLAEQQAERNSAMGA